MSKFKHLEGELMNKRIIFVGAIFTIFFLTSCTSSNRAIVPKEFPGSAKMYKLDDKGNVEVKGYDMRDQDMHWVFVRCDYWSGCYLRCQGPINKCKNIAEKSGLKVSYIETNHTK
jgi:hypothetical protein